MIKMHNIYPCGWVMKELAARLNSVECGAEVACNLSRGQLRSDSVRTRLREKGERI